MNKIKLHKEDLIKTYDRIAKDWYKDHKTDDWYLEVIANFAKLFNPEQEILDVGCGAGDKSKYFTNQGLSVLGIDLSKSMIELSKKNAPKGKFKILDIYQLDKIKKKFDGVYAMAVLLHIPKNDIKICFKLLLNKVKPGGFLFIGVKRKKDKDEEIKEQFQYGYKYERFFSYFSEKEIKDLFNEDFKIVYYKVLKTNNTYWINIIGKKI